jgi:steroid delta-isomerase-like uncharacterized protein
MPATPESMLRAWFDGLWNRGDESTIDRLLHADGVIHGLPTPDGQPIRGPHNFRTFYQAFRSAFPNIAVDVQHVVAQGGKAVGYCRVTGTHRGAGLDFPATGNAIDIFGFAMCEVVDDKVVESWNCFDFLAMYRQLGAEIAPPPVPRTAGA